MADFRRLIEDEKYPYYKKDSLKADDKAFISGLEEGIRLVDDFVAWYEDLVEEDMLGKMRLECVKTAAESLKEYIYSSICEAIVGMADSYDD